MRALTVIGIGSFLPKGIATQAPPNLVMLLIAFSVHSYIIEFDMIPMASTPLWLDQIGGLLSLCKGMLTVAIFAYLH